MIGNGVVKRMVHAFSSDPDELRADELLESVEELGATRVSACGNRARVSVAGTLRSVTLRPRAGTPALEAELWDGSGAVTLVWLGRRHIAGIEPGRRLLARGRLTTFDGRCLIFNPTYDLLPAGDG